jgi:hypothetical protein
MTPMFFNSDKKLINTLRETIDHLLFENKRLKDIIGRERHHQKIMHQEFGVIPDRNNNTLEFGGGRKISTEENNE